MCRGEPRRARWILFHRHRDEAIEPAVIYKEQMSARNELLAGDIQISDRDAIDFDDDHAREQTIGVGRGFLDVGNDETVEARVEAAAFAEIFRKF